MPSPSRATWRRARQTTHAVVAGGAHARFQRHQLALAAWVSPSSLPTSCNAQANSSLTFATRRRRRPRPAAATASGAVAASSSARSITRCSAICSTHQVGLGLGGSSSPTDAAHQASAEVMKRPHHTVRRFRRPLRSETLPPTWMLPRPASGASSDLTAGLWSAIRAASTHPIGPLAVIRRNRSSSAG